MYIVTVQLHVKADKLEEFLKYTLDNASQARQEPGCLRFDVLRHETDPNRFFFYEVYKAPADHKAHQETGHYKRWRDHVPALLAEQRVGARYLNVSPPDQEW
ncbi:MAG: antibiotic biosynthesis monooxygenase [Planctomycetes bacterium]|nr:antibiotic biosynthesis monooxygenase [Planctomycetota bacterium]